MDTFHVVLLRLVFVPYFSDLVGACFGPFLPLSPRSLKQGEFPALSNSTP